MNTNQQMNETRKLFNGLTTFDVLDHGYVKHIEAWGRGEAGEMEAAIIEAARQSTQGSFRGWNVWHCNKCQQNFDRKQDHSVTGIVVAGVMVGALCEADEGWSNDEKLLAFMFNNDHSTPFEFAGMTIEVQAPILVFREWHRHRTQSYNEMSARYAPLPDLNYVPAKERLFLTQKNNTQAQAAKGAMKLSEANADQWLDRLNTFYERAELLYQAGLSLGIPKEVARVVLPVGRYSRMRATANLRNWIAFITLRCQPNAQYEIREYANVVHQILGLNFPHTMKLFYARRAK